MNLFNHTKLKIGVCFILFSMRLGLHAQTKTLLEESRPLTPSAFQFLKFTDMPVGKYTGVANVSIPLYQIVEDGVTIPIGLSYHSGGIRVNEEASEVGLGWSMQFGSIVQVINDLDDLNPNYSKSMPDYVGSTIPTELPYRWEWPWQIHGSGQTLNVGAPQPRYAFPIATGRYYPINGSYDQQQFLSNEYHDSEPDVFKANFLGHYLTFVVDRSNGAIKVLNEKAYWVDILPNQAFNITAPDGVIYTFGLRNAATTLSYANVTTSTNTYGISNSVGIGASSATWVLTQITTKNKHTIDFNYTKTESNKAFTQLSQSWRKVNQTDVSVRYYNQTFLAFMGTLPDTDPAGMLISNFSEQSESAVVPSSITFTNGRVDFLTSDRQDVLGGKKIDNIRVSSQEIIKNISLNYTYSNASAIGGQGFTYNNSVYGNTPVLRLKLASVNTGSEGTYTLNYNTESLPAKNSYAQDQWGFYNGALTNSSLIPNLVQYNRPDLGNNGNNHSARLQYAQAETLNQMIYPTGGSVNFEYELNTFNNYWVPDFFNNTNTTTTGNGLRVKSVIHRSSLGEILKSTIYTYSGGKALLPVNIYRNYTTQYLSGQVNGPEARSEIRTYFIEEYNANGYYSPSTLSNVNGVGYDEVTDKMVDNQGIDQGYTITSFNNTPSEIPSNSVQFMSKVTISVPAIENRGLPKSGSEKSVKIYNQQGQLKKKITNEYTNVLTPFHYGLRVSGYWNYHYVYVDGSTNSRMWSSQPQQIVAIYPIYDFISNLSNSKEIDYFEADSLVKNTNYTYNYYNLPESTIQTSQGRVETTRKKYSWEDSDNPSSNILQASHMLSYPLEESFETLHPDVGQYGISGTRSTKFDYRQEGPLVVKSAESSYLGPMLSKIRTFDRYDEKGNLLQFTEAGKSTSLIWSYNKGYLVGMVENATYSTLENILGASNLVSFSNETPTTQWGVINFLNTLNNDSRTRYAHITSYFYRPLVGVISMTDPKGMTTTYEYDQLFRLKAIKDREGNIVKQFDYHYKQN